MKQDPPIGVPRFISKRFQNLYGYVRDKLYSEPYLRSHLHNIKSKSEKRARRNELKQLAAKVQWVVFLYLLRRFFLTGSEAAEEAVRIFAELKIEKFKIGKKEFFEGSDSVKEGKVLAERLMDAISDKKIKKLILESVWASDIIYHYRNKLYKDQDVYFFDRAQSRTDLRDFFKSSKAKLNSFGSTVNQTVEAYVFAEVIKLHDERGWRVQLKNPKVKNQDVFRLKFSTRGKPDNFSYAVATRDNETFQIRHGLRVSIYNDGEHTRANICCDVAVIKDDDLSRFNTDDPVPNDWLISFAEVKHMSAYPELLASFVGMVHELAPQHLQNVRRADAPQAGPHVAPFLYVSGILSSGAFFMQESLIGRGYDIDIFSHDRRIGSDPSVEEPDLSYLMQAEDNDSVDDLPF